MSSAKLSVTNVAAEPEEEGDGFGGNSISVEVSRSSIEPVSDLFYPFFVASNSDSELYIWEEDIELGSGSGDTEYSGGVVVVPREIDVEVGTGIDLNGDETMVVDEEFESDSYNVINPIDLVEEEPIQVNPPRVNDWQSFLDDEIRFLDDVINMDLGLVRPPTVYEDGMFEAVLARTFDSQEGVRGSPPASKSVVDNLPAVVITSEELRNGDIVCAICKDEIVLEVKAMKLPCKHYYHEECIVPWLGIRNTCPVCRYELPTDDLEYETNKRLQRRG